MTHVPDKGSGPTLSVRLAGQIQVSFKNPEMRERIAAEGFETDDTSAARLHDVVTRDVAKWSTVVKAANIKIAQS